MQHLKRCTRSPARTMPVQKQPQLARFLLFAHIPPTYWRPLAGGVATPTSPWRDRTAGSACHRGRRAQTPGTPKAAVHRSRIVSQSPRLPAGPRKGDVAGRFPSLHTAAGPPGTSCPPGPLPHLQSLLPPNRRKRETTRNMRHRPDMDSVDPSPGTTTPRHSTGIWPPIPLATLFAQA